MAKEVRLPQLGQTMEEGTVVNCLIKVDSEVKKGDILFEIETDKATLEMESPADGFVKRILVEVGRTLPVGTPMLILGEKDEVIPQNFPDSLTAQTAEHAEKKQNNISSAVSASSAVKSETPARTFVSPRAKKLAEELGVNLATVTGTGPAGKITEEDVKKASSTKAAAPTAGTKKIELGDTIPLTKKQRLTAERMVESKREIPCFYLSLRADVTDLVELRSKLNEIGPIKISYNDFIIRAVAIALQKFTVMTGQMAGDAIKLADTINIGLAVSTPNGLIVPVIKDAQQKNLGQIAAETKTLIEKAQNDKLLLTDLEGACITVSNLGAFGIESFIPVVIPGQCSILGIGRILDTCMANNQNRKLMNMTLSVDHKVANGDYAAQFLDFIRKLLEDASTFI
ncbi:MAG: dihydrolipoamide acetyltransferase family protein [Planctomycetota bacterium]